MRKKRENFIRKGFVFLQGMETTSEYTHPSHSVGDTAEKISGGMPQPSFTSAHEVKAGCARTLLLLIFISQIVIK